MWKKEMKSQQLTDGMVINYEEENVKETYMIQKCVRKLFLYPDSDISYPNHINGFISTASQFCRAMSSQ